MGDDVGNGHSVDGQDDRHAIAHDVDHLSRAISEATHADLPVRHRRTNSMVAPTPCFGGYGLIYGHNGRSTSHLEPLGPAIR